MQVTSFVRLGGCPLVMLMPLLGGACGEAQAVANPGSATTATPERCDFVDNNLDGRVDEGFAWRVGPWTKLWSTDRYATLEEAVKLPDGRIVVAGTDSLGEPNDRVVLALLGADGTISSPPVSFPGKVGGAIYATLDSDRRDAVVLAYPSNDWAGCAQGCPVTFVRVGLPGLEALLNVELDLAFRPGSTVGSLRCSNEVCILGVSNVDTGGYSLVWLDAVSGTVERTVDVPASLVIHAVQGTDLLYASRVATEPTPSWELSIGAIDTRTGELLMGRKVVATSPGMTEPNVIPGEESGTATVTYGTTDGTSATGRLMLASMHTDGRFDAREVATSVVMNRHGATALHPGLLVEGARLPFGRLIHRLGVDHEPVPVPANNPVVVDALVMARFLVVPTEGQILLLRADYDGRSVSRSVLSCE